MRISNKMIEYVVTEIAGEDVLELVSYLKNKKNISEFKIAEKINKEVNTTRNMLYRLYNANLVTSIRRKDKKKGWYIYYWTFNTKRVKYLYDSLKKKKIIKLKERLKREEGGNFYICSNGCIRLDFEKATDFEYKCPECGGIMDYENNNQIIDETKQQIQKFEKEMKA